MKQEELDSMKNDLFSLLYFAYIEKCEDNKIQPLVQQKDFQEYWIMWLENGYMSFGQFKFEFMYPAMNNVIIPYLKSKIV